MNQWLVGAAFAVLVSGCSPKLQGSTPKDLAASVEQVRKSLPEKDRERFTESLQLIAFADLNLADIVSATADSGHGFIQKAAGRLKGMTGAQVLALGDSIRNARAAKEREQAVQEIAELRAKRDSSALGREGLAGFKVLRSRFSQKQDALGLSEPSIELTVKNGTTAPVSRAHFTGTITSPGRAVPWHRDDFNYRIPGGLEPGEEATWYLSPNRFSGWGQVDPPKGAVMTVEVVRLDGADGEALFSTEMFSSEDSTRLSELEAEHGR